MTHQIISKYEKEQKNTHKLGTRDLMRLSGCTMKVKVKNTISNKYQFVQGLCIAHVNRGAASSVLLRSQVAGEAVEHRIFIYSPSIEDITIQKSSKGYRRGKLYYLRSRTPKESNIYIHA